MKYLFLIVLTMLAGISHAQQIEATFSCNVVGQGTASNGKDTEKMNINPTSVPVVIKENPSKQVLLISMNGDDSAGLAHTALSMPGDTKSKNLSNKNDYKLSSTTNLSKGSVYEDVVLNKNNGALIWNTVITKNDGVTIRLHIEGKCYK